MKKQLRLTALFGALALLAAACGTSDGDSTTAAAGLPGEGREVVAGRANWSTGYFQAAIYAALLEELGFEVSDPAAAEFPPNTGYFAMAERTIDFWPNSWYPGHLSWHESELPEGTVADYIEIVGGELLSAGLEGILITKSVAEEYNITSLEQINSDPALTALFDSDGDGIADLFGCPEDWTCDDIISDTLEFNEWTNIKQTIAGYEAMLAESLDRVNEGKPALQYTWSPSGYLTQLVPGDNVLWLSLGSNDFVLDGTTSDFDFSESPAAPLGDACTADPCWLGFAFADIQVTANKEFLQENPAARALFEAVELNVIDVALQNVKYDGGENSEDDVKRHAKEWIADNRATVDMWIDAALAGA